MGEREVFNTETLGYSGEIMMPLLSAAGNDGFPRHLPLAGAGFLPGECR